MAEYQDPAVARRTPRTTVVPISSAPSRRVPGVCGRCGVEFAATTEDDLRRCSELARRQMGIVEERSADAGLCPACQAGLAS